MSASGVATAIERIIGDTALMRSLVAITDPASLARELAQLGATEAAWLQVLSGRTMPGTGSREWRSIDAPPRGWLPLRLFEEHDGWHVEWVHFLFQPLASPFFEDDAMRARAHPLNRLLRCATPVEAVAKFAETDQPDLLVFHMSRCGSTLVAQMLAALDRVTVLSEPPPFDQALRLYLAGEVDARIVRGMAAALAPDVGERARLRAIKLDAWHTLSLDRVIALFPLARAVFLFRDPVEVLVSLGRVPGMHAAKGVLPLETYGLPDSSSVDPTDFAAMVITEIARRGLDAAERHGVQLCDYADLPAAVCDTFLPECGIEPTQEEARRLADVAERHAKAPGQTFASDARAKHDAAGADLLERVRNFGLGDLHAALSHTARAQHRRRDRTSPVPPVA
ncbi:hypothetical protein [Erythrobacter sp. JK5]|uniref:hypothetical protein n=1 Tax=Erythrobacter sp. JK5 TaxID=2829500 RepID=UPI001BA64D53|nr:hypothetical protein [Erythrobacter sp. JK5]QUL37545.1 hypothetical protein KDC96_14545 [Erythrobacter sp. JK5]